MVRDLDVTLDQERRRRCRRRQDGMVGRRWCLDRVRFAPHIPLLSRDCYYQLRYFRLLTSNATATLINSFATTRLDYCCSLYISLPAGRSWCLDRVLRSAARVIRRIPKFGHVFCYAKRKFCIPLQQRILFIRSCPGVTPSAWPFLCLPARALLLYLGYPGSPLTQLR